MPPDERPIPRYIAEHPRESLPYGRWAEALSNHFLEACRRAEPEDEELGDPGQLTWSPDRTYGRRTDVPATAARSTTTRAGASGWSCGGRAGASCGPRGCTRKGEPGLWSGLPGPGSSDG